MGTVPTPYVPVAGDDATQARVLTWADAANYLLGNTTSGGSRRPFTVLRQTVAQSLTSGTATDINFDTEGDTGHADDYDNGHSTVTNTNRYTAQTAGWYYVAGQVGFVGNATGLRFVQLSVNGTTVQPGSEAGFATVPNAGNIVITTPLRPVYLAVNDYVTLQGIQASGGALNTLTGNTQSMMFVGFANN